LPHAPRQTSNPIFMTSIICNALFTSLPSSPCPLAPAHYLLAGCLPMLSPPSAAHREHAFSSPDWGNLLFMLCALFILLASHHNYGVTFLEHYCVQQALPFPPSCLCPPTGIWTLFSELIEQLWFMLHLLQTFSHAHFNNPVFIQDLRFSHPAYQRGGRAGGRARPLPKGVGGKAPLCLAVCGHLPRVPYYWPHPSMLSSNT